MFSTMPDPDKSTRNIARTILLAVVLGLPVISWTGLLDNVSGRDVDSALLGAGTVYATARAINGIVSVLQGTEINAVLVTITIGEILDPVNDLIERFSGIMLFALGSLALQKILLSVVSHTVFNVLLTALALAAGYAVLQETRYSGVLLRAFLVTVLVRFSLALVVLANYSVDAWFLRDADARRLQAMEQFQHELNDVRELAASRGASPAAIRQAELALEALEETERRQHAETARLQQELQAADAALDKLRAEQTLPERLFRETPAIAAARQQLDEAEQRVEKAEAKAAATRDQLTIQREDLECLRKRAAGEACSLMERVTGTFSPTEIRRQIESLEQGVGAFAENAINLLVSMLLKTVIIPLAFFYALLRAGKALWSRVL
jgi:hypothetical protein